MTKTGCWILTFCFLTMSARGVSAMESWDGAKDAAATEVVPNAENPTAVPSVPEAGPAFRPLELEPHPLETIPPGEEETSRSVSQMILSGMDRLYPPGTPMVPRDAHNKAHLCVSAAFAVEPGLPPEYENGLFARGGDSFESVIRFSNGSGGNNPDEKGDGRGMAVKVFGVGGGTLFSDGPSLNVQDFLMINHPVFFVRNAADYVDFQDAARGPRGLDAFFRPDLTDQSTWRIHEATIAGTITAKKISNPLDLDYFSMSPYAWGQAKAVKYSARPRPCGAAPAGEEPEANDGPRGDDHLKDKMLGSLSKGPACYDFFVQIGGPGMPIEDPTIEWKAPWRKVAGITIKKLKTGPDDTEGVDRIEDGDCESMIFDPWHALAEHRPLGGINRLRKVVYEAISFYRNSRNSP